MSLEDAYVDRNYILFTAHYSFIMTYYIQAIAH